MHDFVMNDNPTILVTREKLCDFILTAGRDSFLQLNNLTRYYEVAAQGLIDCLMRRQVFEDGQLLIPFSPIREPDPEVYTYLKEILKDKADEIANI